MGLPVPFRRLVDEGGWLIVCDDRDGLQYRGVIKDDLLKFGYDEGKDVDPQFWISKLERKPRMAPFALAKRMGFSALGVADALQFIAGNPQRAAREIDKYEVRKRYLEPLLIAPVLPFLVVLPFIPASIRNKLLGLIGRWSDGPVQRVVN